MFEFKRNYCYLCGSTRHIRLKYVPEDCISIFGFKFFKKKDYIIGLCYDCDGSFNMEPKYRQDLDIQINMELENLDESWISRNTRDLERKYRSKT